MTTYTLTQTADYVMRGNHEASVCIYADGIACEDVSAFFSVDSARYARESHPDGPSRGTYTEWTAELVALSLGGGWIDRNAALEIFGAAEVARVEAETAEQMQERAA